MSSLVFRLCDNAPEILRDVCLERGWREFEEEEDEDGTWNLWWKSSGFRTSDFESCLPWQRVNHFPKSNSITRKDSLARNLKRMKGVYGNILFNFAPMSFNLPNDYRKFVTEYSKDKNKKKVQLWICKPVDQSRGKGIFLFRNLNDLTYDCATVVQQYIQNPLLIAGYKFDLRLYVLVTSFHPLNIYLYHEGIVRFGTDKFDLNSLDNVYSHLTNTSINKLSPFYSADKERIGSGCKWSLSQLRTYFHQHHVNDKLLWHRITSIIVLTLLMQAPEVHNRTNNCFELFGFDVLVDANLKPWLLEVNFSPSLGIDCALDITIKKALLNDTLKAINLKDADSSPCSLNGCITKLGTCARNQGTMSRASSKHSFCSSQSKVSSSSRFYTRSRLPRMSPAVISQMSKESSDTDTSFPEEEVDIATAESALSEQENSCETSSLQKCQLSTDVNNNKERERESLSRSGDSSSLQKSRMINPETLSGESVDLPSGHYDCNSHIQSESSAAFSNQDNNSNSNVPSQCPTTNATNDSKNYVGANLEISEPDEQCQCSLESTCKLHWRSSSHLSQCFASAEFKQAFTYSKSMQDTDTDLTRTSTNSKRDCYNSSDNTSRLTKTKTVPKTTKLPPLKRNYQKVNSFTFVKRSPKIAPYLPTRWDIPRRTSVYSKVNCSCGHYPQRWGANRHNPDQQIGDYILVFPFNETTQKACMAKSFDTKAAVDEVKKVIQKITTLEKSKRKANSASDETEKGKLDLNKTFWGFSSVFNWPS